MTAQNGTQEEKSAANMIALSILDSDIKIPPMPASGARIMSMAQQPIDNIDLAEFCSLIEPDPGLFTRIIQLSNSPFYRGVNEIVSLRTAVVRIGLEEAVNAANLYFLQRFLPRISDLKGFSAEEYWSFSWACAVAGKRLGHPKLADRALPGELYIAGLLHGIGKLILAIQYPKEFSQCIQSVHETGLTLDQVIKEKFGTPDNYIAAKLMKAWDIPSKICDAVEYYNNPEAAPDETKEIAGLTQLANRIAAISENPECTGDEIESRIGECWIVQDEASPLSRPETRDRVTKEILAMIHKKSASMSHVEPEPEPVSPDPGMEKKPDRKPEQTVPAGKRPLKEKKGFFSWLKSLFR